MKQKRDKVFIWVTWLTKLISGEAQCEYASWFKAHYKHDKVPTSFDLTKWAINHNQLLHKRRDELEKEGYTVKIEDQNSFKYEFCIPRKLGTYIPENENKITISGKVDIVALGEHQAIVEDCKTGAPKNSDQVQVMLYMMFLPKSIEEYKDITFDGCVVYEDSEIPISWEEIDSNLKEVVWNLIKRIGNDKSCRKVPSYNECNWCDINKEDCPERIE